VFLASKMTRAYKVQVTMILEELENSFSEILAERRGTVVGALLAACLRFRIKQREASYSSTLLISSGMLK
jgi:hypothetical protein